MAVEQDWAAYADQAFLALTDTLLVRTAAGAGAEIFGSNLVAQRTGSTGEFLATHSGDVGIRAQTSGTVQSAYFGLIAQQAGVNDQWNIVAAGSGLGAASLRFVRGTWTNTPAGMFDASGNFLVGVTSNAAISTSGARVTAAGNTVISSATDGILALGFNGAAATATVAAFYRGSSLGGSITTNGTTTSYNTSSDARLKDAIADADDAGQLIDAVQVRKFDWISTGEHEPYGFVAQELIEVVPAAVYAPEDPEQMMAVDHSKLVPLLVKELQALRARVAELEAAK